MSTPLGGVHSPDHRKVDTLHADTVLDLPPGEGSGLPLYASYFGLHQAPFSIAPDPRYLFMSERHREALAHLLYGVSGGGGFVVLTGEIGAGKTTVCRCFLEQIPRRCNVAYIFNPKLTVSELLNTICAEFGVPCPPAHQSVSTKVYVDALNEYLLRTHAVGQNNVLIIDEAQNLSADVLEQLRLLTNLETAERKLLQIILIGQPELRDMLARPELEQLSQRVIARFHLDALSPAETRDYIQHRLLVAGYRREPVFDDKAARRVHQLTQGVPRRINLLCDRALLGAYARSRSTVDARMVDTAAAEVFMPQSGKVSSLSAPPAKAPRDTRAATPDVARADRPRRPRNEPVWAAWQTWVWLGTGLLAVSGAISVGWAWKSHADARAQRTSASLSGAVVAKAAPGQASGATPAVAAGAASATAPVATTPLAEPPTPALRPAGAPASWPATPSGADGLSASPAQPALSAWGAESDAVRKLAAAWGQSWHEADPCASEGPSAHVHCFRSPAGLSLIRQLDRPVVLALRDAAHPEAYVLLWGLDGDQALIEGPKGLQTWPLSVVSARWRGDFLALWRAPDGYRSKILAGQKSPALDWLATRLSQLDHGPAPSLPVTLNADWTSRVLAFQVAQGLRADGVVGATTFMQINRLTGVGEPGLLRHAPTGKATAAALPTPLAAASATAR